MHEFGKTQFIESKPPLEEKCGTVTLYLPNHPLREQIQIAKTAAGGVQHRGQLGVGIAYQTPEGLFVFAKPGLLLDVLTPETIANFPEAENNPWVQIHARYGTDGDYDDRNLQPAKTKAPNRDELSVIHNGQFVNKEGLKRLAEERTGETYPNGISDTYLFAQALAHAKGDNWREKLLNTLDEVNGAYSLTVGVGDSVFIARDRFGIRPMVLGRVMDGWIAASETFALDKIGVKTEREVLRGEVIEINREGLHTIREGYDGQGNFCDFEWSYFSRPNSNTPTHEQLGDSYHPERWLSMLVAREKAGHLTIKRNPIPHATVVVGVPDSGVAFGTGISQESGIPYRQLILRDHYDENGNMRLFQGDQDMGGIKRKVLGKLSLVTGPGTWKDAVVILGDDSIVRGNVSEPVVKAIFEEGAKEVHLMSGFSEVLFPCPLGVSMRTQPELIAYRHNSNRKLIAEEIGATSVTYTSHEDLIRSRKPNGEIVIPDDPKDIFLVNGGCGGCLTGRYPIDRDGNIYIAKSAIVTRR